jgi:uncharacterized protein (TIGR02001 family)
MVKAPPAVAPAPAPSPWDVAFGGAIMSDYNFRGISQSSRAPSVGAYLEPQFNISPMFQLYTGIAGYSIRWPRPLSDPAAEIDLYGGVRAKVGDFTLDLGTMYYWYPRERAFQSDFWEFYAKASYTFMETVTVGANVFHAPDWLNLNVTGTYLAGTLKVAMPSNMMAPGVGAYVSGELGTYLLGRTAGYNPRDYLYWNAGIGVTYKALTFDLRYHDTDNTRAQCFAIVLGPPSSRKWCGPAIIGKIAFDTTLGALK